MTNTLRKPPPSMTVAEFLAWPGDGTGRKFQLVDGEVRAMSPASTTHGRIQSRLSRLVGNWLEARGSPCDIITEPAVATHVRAHINLRVPDLGITCVPDAAGQLVLPDPVALIEILSPGNVADTWENVWSYCTIPSVQEIIVVHSTRVLAEALRRGPDGHWPKEPEEIGQGGTLSLDSISFACPLSEVYAKTHLAGEPPS
ncbi:MAG: Uma2 family endonuclease [Longimicrobiales bacterium]